MTIYLTKWVHVEENVNVPKVHASTSLVEAKKKYNELKSDIKTLSVDLDLLPINEAITKHSPKTQADVIELINSL